MDFSLSQEHQMFRRLFREFAEREVAGVAAEIDQNEALPPALLRKAAEQGFWGASLHEDWGGAGLDWLALTFLIEELARPCRSTALAVGLHLARAALAIAESGTPAQQEAYLPGLAAGDCLGAWAFTEPDAGSDLSALQTFAVRDGEDYLLDGVKTWVTHAGLAGLFVVFAATRPEAGAEGISAFIVRRENPGVFVGYREPTLGLRGLGMHTVYFDSCRVPATDRLGEENGAWAIGERAEDRARLVVAAAALGAAEAALDMGVQFSLQREQFGGPIARKQAIQNFVAETTVEVEALRDLLLHTAWLADSSRDLHERAAMTKLFAGSVAQDAANRMVQLHGGSGYMEDFPMARLYRDVRALRILGGADELQKFEVAAERYLDEDLSLAR